MPGIRHIFGLVVMAVLSAHQLYAIVPVAIDDKIEQHIFTASELEYMEDSCNCFSFEQVSSDAFNQYFIENQLFAPHNDHVQSAYWIRIKLVNNPASSRSWLLEFFDQTIDYIEAYIPDEHGHYQLQLMGDDFPFAHKYLRHKNFEIKVPNQQPIADYYYFKVKSRNLANIIIVLRSLDWFIYYALNEYFLFGIFYGMILIIAIYNLLMYAAIKENQYMIYVFYVICGGLYFMSIDGTAYQYLWPESPVWNQLTSGIFSFLVIILALFFTKSFLHTNHKFPAINRLINIVIGTRIVLFLLTITLIPAFLFESRVLEVFPLFICFFAGIYAFYKRYKPARFFVLAYGLLFTGFIIKILLNLDLAIINGTIFTNYSIHISFGIELIVLSFALGDKVRIIKYTKDLAQRRIIKQHEQNQRLKDKVNKELEQEVQKRTRKIASQKTIIESQNHELMAANEKLRQQADEIKKINVFLDVDNYKLKSRIKQEMLARAATKNMEYPEFKKIFPDTLSCFRYLEDLKWEKGFTCKKCSNTKYLKGKHTFDRRCTRCGYNESTTAFTLFHGIRFPIQKAFYIVHLVITERDDLTIDEISETLELRRNTCWNFRGKVLKIVSKHKKDKDYFENWKNVIFNTTQEMVL